MNTNIDTNIANELLNNTAAASHQCTLQRFFSYSNREKAISFMHEQVRLIKSFVNNEFSYCFSSRGRGKYFNELPSGAKANFRYFLAMSETAWDTDRQNAFAKVFHSKRFNKNGELNHFNFLYAAPCNIFATREEAEAVVVPA